MIDKHATTLLVLDLLGVFVFALSGATLAVERRLDVFGVLVLAVVAALGGGLMRDLLLGATPPAALKDWRYLSVAIAAGAATFVGADLVQRLAGAVRLFDAAGLGLFVASGTTKALDSGLGTAGALAVGCLTGIGGGLLRDLLVRDVPVVMRREIYAVPALIGAAVIVVADGHDLPRATWAVAGAVLAFTLRMLGVWRDWHAPVAPLRKA